MSAIKNFFTGGNYGKLELEEAEFHNLASQFTEFQDEFVAINQTLQELTYYLQEERTQVARNVSMAKNQIARIKDIRNSNNQKIKKDEITTFDIKNIEFTVGDVSIDFQGHLDSVSASFVNSLEDSLQRLGNNKTFTKADLKNEAAIVGIQAVVSGIGTLISLNSEVNGKRREIVAATKQIRDAMPGMMKKATKVYTDIKRINEIIIVLNKYNEAFSKKYQEINSAINKKSKFYQFIDHIKGRKIEPDDLMEQNLHVLRQYASEYSSFNQAANL